MHTKEQYQSEIDKVISFLSKGKFQIALEKILELSEKFPEDSLIHNIIGACYAGQGHLDSAIKNYQKAIEINPKYAKAHYNLADAYHQQNKYDESINSYKNSLEIDPNYPEAHNNLGNVFRETGALNEAKHFYESALQIDPKYIEANYGLGIIFHELGELNLMIEQLELVLNLQPSLAEAHNRIGAGLEELGKLDEAVNSFQKAIKINPNFSEAYNNLGNVYKELGQLEESVNSYKRALAINPDFPALHNNLGNVYKELGKLENALDSYQEALSYNPDYPDSLNNLGVIYFKLGELEKSAQFYEKAIKINPNFAEACNNLGNVFKKLNQFENAVGFYKKAIDIDPDFFDAHNNLGLILSNDKKLLDDAVKSFKKAIAINPKFSIAYNNLAHTFRDMNKPNEASKSYQKAIELDPQFFAAYNNYGNLLAKDFNQLNDAVACFERAIEINPDFAIAHNNLAHALIDLNQLDEALNSYEKAMKIMPNLDNVLGNVLSTKMNSCNWDNLPSLLSELKQKIVNNEKVINPFALLGLIDDAALQRLTSEKLNNFNHPKSDALAPIKDHPRHQKIRIGYFSGDFREHPVAYLTAELYEVHDRSHFEIHAFSFSQATHDEMNLRIKAGVDHFHDVHAMSHQEIAELARSLEIDIAVDLGGLTAEARTDVFAICAAPIQMSYIGYLGTMGADYYDYLIADSIMIPKESQKYYMEKIVYLPSFQVNDSKDLPPNITLTRKDVGLPDKGFVFCCFNNTYKFTPTTFDSWARILLAVKDSVLIVYTKNELSKTNLTKEIEKRGVESKRLIFADTIDRPNYLARYRVADLFLDTQPYNAGTTASDALKMGLPMITLKGQSYQARMGASIVSALNLPELITNSAEEYESLAIELATNPGKLKAVKEKLASNLSTAPLYDTKLFTKNLESAYTQMYERYHEGLKPDHIYVE